MRPTGVIKEVRSYSYHMSWSTFLFNSVMAISTVRSTPRIVCKVAVVIHLCIVSLLLDGKVAVLRGSPF